MLIRDAEVEGRRVDVRVVGGRIAAMHPALPRRGDDVLDADVLDAEGAALLPGLTDHHLHLHALAAAERSIRCGPPVVHDRDALRRALALATPDEHGWVRGVGYHELVAGELDGESLDALHPHRPVRMQHRSGALWIVNGRGSTLLGLADGDLPGVERDDRGAPTGRLWRADDWLRTRLLGGTAPDLTAVGIRLARLGITTVTDATPGLRSVDVDAVPQHVHLLGLPLDAGAPRGVTVGPHKIVLADSGLPGLDALAGRVRAAHARGRGVAVHCVTREALVLLLAALDDAGAHPGDRIEHAALVPPDLLDELARRRLRVVTQPGFIADRGDTYLHDVPATEHADLYRCRSLLDAGVPLALSSDAPYGPLDPWAVIAAAVERRTPGRAVVGPAEALTPGTALAAYLSPAADPGGAPQRVAVDAPADLVLLDSPLRDALRAPAASAVRATLIGGRREYG